MAEVSPVKQSSLTFVVALLVILGGCTSRPDGVEPLSPFDVQRYKGEWFEITRLDHSFERGLTNVTATYTLRDDGSVGVLNRGFWPFSGGYHVFALDRQDYGWALISGPSRSYLWILARQPNLSADIRNRLVDQARSLGFPVDELILVDHGPTTCAPGGSP